MRSLHPVFTYAIIFSAIFLLHAPLLRLPYFWDEAGYYVPAARDLLLAHSLIPHSTLSSAHPPLVLVWLALWWKLSGFTPAVTRTAMLMVAPLCLLGTFRLARTVANTSVALGSTVALALYPVFFAQSSMAQLDVAAAAFSVWALTCYFEDRLAMSAVMLCVAVLCKETALITAIAIAGWHLGWRILGRKSESEFAPPPRALAWIVALVAAPAAVLVAWYGFHYAKTGYVFGSPEFFSYNVSSTVQPLRIVLAFIKRVWQLVGYMNMFVLTLAAFAAMTLLEPRLLSTGARETRPRIELRSQGVMGAVIAAYVIALSLVGGAVLARYMLPVVPLMIILCVSTLWRRVRHWAGAMLIVYAAFAVGLVVNPPYVFAPEDNLAYRDYVLLHKRAATFLDERFARSRVLTAWPATDELSHPYLGYTKVAIPVVAIENFSAPELLGVARDNSLYDVAVVFSTKYEPSRDLARLIPGFEALQTRFFGFHRDLPADVAAQLLGGRVIYSDARHGQWIAVIEIERPENATMPLRPSLPKRRG
ncbi:MAG: glycosyltransferase family 39 protein [Acidobacteriaceae bacterium]|nr:glycosyltransferase family 39 protein [Acidobacteriaceae bacterium]